MSCTRCPAINDAAYPIGRVRKSDPKLVSPAQDNRSAASIEPQDADAHLFGTPQQRSMLLPAPALKVMDAGPA
jgi:hypothetical protein